MNEPQVKALADCFVQTLSPDPVSPQLRSGKFRLQAAAVSAFAVAGEDQGSWSPTEKRVRSVRTRHYSLEGRPKVSHELT